MKAFRREDLDGTLRFDDPRRCKGLRVHLRIGRSLVASVQMTTRTVLPAAAQRASVPPQEMTGSSGWA